MLSPEREILLVSGRLTLGIAGDEDALTLLRLPLNWSYLLKMAEVEGMEGIVAYQLQRLARTYDLALPLEPFTEALHRVLAHNMALLVELSALCEEFQRHGVQAILLKGGALIETVYRGHPGLRPMCDIDLLVKDADLSTIKEILRKRGYRPSSPSSQVFHNGWAAIDLHTDLIGSSRIRRRALAFRFKTEWLWQEAVPLVSSYPSLLVLPHPDQFLHLAFHALKHSFSRLIWFVDLGMVYQYVKWEDLVDRAGASGCLRALSYALFLLQALLQVKISQEVLVRLPRLNWWEQRFLNAVASRRPVGVLGEVMVAFSIVGLGAKLGYLLELGFPKKAVLAEVFPSTPSWLLYPHRLLQLTALGFRAGRDLRRS